MLQVGDEDGLVQPELKELCVFRLGLLEDRDTGIGVFPEREEVLVGFPGFRHLARERGAARWVRAHQRYRSEEPIASCRARNVSAGPKASAPMRRLPWAIMKSHGLAAAA